MPTWKAYAKKDDITATKLDDFAAPDDNTDLNATNARHGLLLKLIDDTTKFLRSDGSWNVPAGAALTSKVITATRDLTAASGDVSYTGVGFIPTVLLVWFQLSTGASLAGIGFSDSAKTNYCYNTLLAGGSAYLIAAGTGSTNYQRAIVKTYDADGFTLTWTKTGSPTGTLNLYFLCLK